VYADDPHGSLSNGGEKIYLEQPGNAAPGMPTPYLLIDAVNYDDDPPWTTLADGGGPSLSRFSPTAYGNDVGNWGAGASGGTPGRLNVTLDTSPPAAPENLTGRIVSVTQVRLRWDEAVDPQSGVQHYNVYRNNLLVGAAPLGVFTDTVSFAATAFSYEVSSVNGDGFESPRTPILSIGGQTVSFQQGVGGYSGADDATIRQAAASTAFGSESPLEVDGEDGGVDKSVLLRWADVTLPAGSLLVGAAIAVNVVDPTSSTYGAYPVLRDWVESTVTWNAPWETAGALGPGDRGSTSVTTFTGGTGSQTFNLNAAGIALVEGWIAGTTPNHGVIVADAASTDGFDFDSSESSIGTGPKLILVYIAQPTPQAPGDVNEDGGIDAADIDDLFAALAAGSDDVVFDIDGSGSVDPADIDWLVTNVLGTRRGDTNLDGRVDRYDLAVLAMNYGRRSGGRWSTADFNGDGRIDLTDIGLLQNHFGFVSPSPGPSPEFNSPQILRSARRAALADRAIAVDDDSLEATNGEWTVEEKPPLRARRSATVARRLGRESIG
jgi:hypothetical protein